MNTSKPTTPSEPAQVTGAPKRQYVVRPKSGHTATVDDIPLPSAEYIADKLTCRILRPELVPNAHDAAASVKATIMHQRRGSKTDQWADADSFNQATMPAGQQVRMRLDCAETRALYEALHDLYTVYESGLPDSVEERQVVNPKEVYIGDNQQKAIIAQLLANEGPGFWEILRELSPGLLEKQALAQLHAARLRVLEQFSEQLSLGQWSEQEWDDFLDANDWIFGHGLKYAFLRKLERHPHLGGTNVTGSGELLGDFLMASEADICFTVLVEIKKPTSPLLGRRYRNNVFAISEELAGAVSQVQSQCDFWARKALETENAERLTPLDIYTHQPAGILIAGHLSQLHDPDPTIARAKRRSFELFRRNLHNPEIITYDELIARARFIVDQQEPAEHGY